MNAWWEVYRSCVNGRMSTKPCSLLLTSSKNTFRPHATFNMEPWLIKEALSDPELVHFDGVGTLESWNSDGLRSLIKTMPNIPNMIEKTLRYPGLYRIPPCIARKWIFFLR